MRFVYKCSLLGAACFLSVYGCHSGDDDTGGAQAGSPGTGGSGAKAGGGGSGGSGGTKPASGGTGAKPAGGEGGQAAGAGDNGGPADSGGAAPGGAGGQNSGEQGGNGPGSAGSGGAAGDTASATACIKDVAGRYVIRHDGAALYEPNSGTERIIVDAGSGAPIENVRSVADGSYHGCAVLADESVVCWQTNNAYGNQYGQLGNGTTDSNTSVYRATPVLTAADTPLTGIVALAEIGPGTQNENNACAVSDDGKLWCWGELTWIANNGTSLRTGYAQAITLDGDIAMTGVLQAAVTKEFACALRSGSPNSVWCWGYNASGELAQADLNRRQYPTEVSGLTAPTRVVASNASSGENTACALDDGKVRCWGYNSSPGAVGGKLDSTTFDVQVPTQVVLEDGSTPLDGVTDLRSGLAQFVALRDGAVWIWGSHAKNYASNYGAAAVTLVGSAGGLSNTYGPRYVTSDGEYHDNKIVLPVTCSGLP